MVNFIIDIPKRLKIARIASGYNTAKEFTTHHNIPASTYSQHENGKRALSLQNIFNYAQIINIDATWLITGQGNPCGEYGDQSLEELILEEQERLIKKGELHSYETPLLSTQQRYSTVNVSILKKIFIELLPLLRQTPAILFDESLDFCFDLYNKILLTNANDEEQVNIIKICFESFTKGLKIGLPNESLKKVVR